MSRLDAVNLMLSTLRVNPVSSITPPYSGDVARALRVLNEVDREVQTKGWHFNRDDEVVLVLDSNSKYVIPSNVVRITVPSPTASSPDLTPRRDTDSAMKLYDKKNQTFVLSAGLKATIIRLFDFEDTPVVYREYVARRAARVFQSREQGDPQLGQEAGADELRALKDLRTHEAAVDTRTIFDGWSAARVINRQYPQIEETLDS
jgi:hypothetical protein